MRSARTEQRTNTRLSWFACIVVAAFVSAPCASYSTEESVLNEEIEVSHAERMNYPLAARVHVVEGAVIIRAELQKDGAVQSASAMSGPTWLLDECLKNAKKWRFSRIGPRATAFIVYVFQIKGVCELPCPSNFEFYPPNLVIVSMGSPLVMPQMKGIDDANPRQTISREEAREIVFALLGPDPTKLSNFSLEHHAFPYAPEFYFFDGVWDNPHGSVIQGHYAVNPWTGDIWDPIACTHVTSPAAKRLQESIRKRFRLGKDEYLKLRAEKPAC